MSLIKAGDIKPLSGSILNILHPLSERTRGLWLFNEGSGLRLSDLSSFGNHGTLTNMDPVTDWVGGGHGFALDFDGGNDVIDIGKLGKLPTNMDTRPPSVSFWIKTTSTAQGWFLGTRNGASITRLDARINTNSGGTQSTGSIQGFMIDDSNLSLIFGVNTDTGITDGLWHNVLIVWDVPNNTGRIYIDGVSQSITINLAQSPASFSDLSKNMFIGGFNDGGAPLTPIVAQIQQLTLFDTAITDSEAEDLFNNRYGLVSSSRSDSVRFLNILGGFPSAYYDNFVLGANPGVM
jgi:hypothetical protein